METNIYDSVVRSAAELVTTLSSENMSPSLEEVTHFSTLTKAMRREIKRGFRSGEYCDAKILQEHTERIQRLHCAFMKLVKKLEECLETIEQSMIGKAAGEMKDRLLQWTTILDVLTCCYRIGKTFEIDADSIKALALAKRVPVNALAMFAKRNYQHFWILRCKDVTNSESRRSLAMMLFPGIGDDRRLPPLNILITDKSQLFSESFKLINEAHSRTLHGGISVQFKEEESTDPSILKNWFVLIFREIFSPQKALFLPCLRDRRRFFPKPASNLSPTLIEQYRFTGRLVALALRHEIQVGITLDRLFFKLICIGMRRTFDKRGFDPYLFQPFTDYYKFLATEDFKDYDTVLYRNFEKFLELDNELLDSDDLELTFFREVEENGIRRSINLNDDYDEDDNVNSTNKEIFIQDLMISYIEPICQQIFYFAKGIQEMFSKSYYGKRIFKGLDYQDFDLMIRGEDDLNIDIEDWKAHVILEGYTNEDQQIIFFWKVIEEMTARQRKAFICFWTSIRVLPLDGFKSLEEKLRICNTFDTDECLKLPASQTDFFRLLLPPYPSMAIMQDKLQSIIQYCFGLSELLE